MKQADKLKDQEEYASELFSYVLQYGLTPVTDYIFDNYPDIGLEYMYGVEDILESYLWDYKSYGSTSTKKSAKVR